MSTITGTVQGSSGYSWLITNQTGTTITRQASGNVTPRTVTTLPHAVWLGYIQTSTLAIKRTSGQIGYGGVPFAGSVIGSGIVVAFRDSAMSYKPGDTLSTQFCTQRADTSIATNADSTPNAIFTRNGVDDLSVTCTVTNLSTGRYGVQCSIPGGYASGDAVQVSVTATVNSITGKAIVESSVLDGYRLTDIVARLGAFTGTGLSTIFGWLRAMIRSTGGILPGDIGGTYDNTLQSLEASASGGGGTADWTTGEKSQIRKALGVTGTTTATTGTGLIDDIKAKTDQFQFTGTDVKATLDGERTLLDLTDVITFPGSVDLTLHEILQDAQSQAGGWSIDATLTPAVLTVFAPDKTTVLYEFELTPNGGPYITRTRV